MKNVTEIKKIFKRLNRFLLVFSVVSLALSFLYLVFPNQMKNLFGVLGGAALVIIGVLFAFYHFKKKNDISLFSAELFSAVFLFLSGLALIICRKDLTAVLPFVVGCFLFACAIVIAQTGLNLFYLEFGYWWAIVLFGATSFFLSFLCFVKWDRLMNDMFRVLGFELLFIGLSCLGTALVSNRLSTRILKIAEGYAEKKRKEDDEPSEDAPEEHDKDDEEYTSGEESEEELMKRFAPPEEEKMPEKEASDGETVSRDDFAEASRQAAKERDEAAEERKNRRRDLISKAKDVLPKIPTDRFKDAEDVSVNKDQPGSTWRDKPEGGSKPDFDAEGDSEDKITPPEETHYMNSDSKNVFEI